MKFSIVALALVAIGASAQVYDFAFCPHVKPGPREDTDVHSLSQP